MPSGKPSTIGSILRLRPSQLLLLLGLVIGFAIISTPGMLYPWSHFTGVSFHLMPWWSGEGSFTAPEGQYQIYLFLGPMDTGSTPMRVTALSGTGQLCTPSGERLSIQVAGSMDKPLWMNTLGKPIEITTYVRSKPGTFSAYTPPASVRLILNGIWGVGKIDARGMLDHQPPAPGHPHPPKPAPIAVTLKESGRWWTLPCPAR